MYDIPVPKSRHPMVIEWVEGMVTSCIIYISKYKVKTIALVIISHDNQALERYVLNIEGFPNSLSEKEKKIAISNFNLTWGDIMQEYRSCISFLKTFLSSKPNIPNDLPEGSTFTTTINIEDGNPDLPNSSSIVESDITLPWISIETDAKNRKDTPLSYPISVVDIGPIGFNVFVEVPA